MGSWVGKIPWKRDRLPTAMFLGFPGGSDGKESACNVGDLGLIPGSGRSPGGGHGNPLQYSCLENPHEQRSLAGHSPWGREDRTERLSTHHTARSVTLIWSPDLSVPQFSQLNMGLVVVKCNTSRTSVVVQWLRLRIHLSMQWTWVQSLVREDSTCHARHS